DPKRTLSHESMQMLLLYNWPGNVRELKNVVDRAKIISDGDLIQKDSIILDSAFGPGASANPLSTISTPSIPMMSGFGSNPNFDPIYTKLNERQRKLIEYLKTYGRIKNRDYYEIMKVSKSTGWRDIKNLIARNILAVHGKGKGSVYTLVERDKWDN
ncbi:MAG: hypothetical protein P1V97_03400, partial [Planctomycetota bacterium]|nr:hypothetical protein [Planctomycetota bacterium]